MEEAGDCLELNFDRNRLRYLRGIGFGTFASQEGNFDFVYVEFGDPGLYRVGCGILRYCSRLRFELRVRHEIDAGRSAQSGDRMKMMVWLFFYAMSCT